MLELLRRAGPCHPRVAVNVSDPDAPARYLGVRGRVVEITTEGATEHIESLAQRYLGAPDSGTAAGTRRG
jgi:hypothetical protein